MISLIWIKRISDEEDKWIEENLINIDKRYEIIVVGHTKLDPQKYNFKYIPFYENDHLGLICHKKNLGVINSSREYCLVLHSDACPVDNFYDIALSKNYDDNTAVCPIGYYNGNRSLSWCTYGGGSRDINLPADHNTYISGAAIFGKKTFFQKFYWNENLGHNREEDLELSRRIFNNGGKLIPDKDLLFNSRRSQ